TLSAPSRRPSAPSLLLLSPGTHTLVSTLQGQRYGFFAIGFVPMLVCSRFLAAEGERECVLVSPFLCLLLNLLLLRGCGSPPPPLPPRWRLRALTASPNSLLVHLPSAAFSSLSLYYSSSCCQQLFLSDCAHTGVNCHLTGHPLTSRLFYYPAVLCGVHTLMLG